MSNVRQLGKGILDPKTMLLEAASNAEDYEDVIIIARRKDDGVTRWSTTKSYWFFFACAAMLTDLALDALNGRVKDE